MAEIGRGCADSVLVEKRQTSGEAWRGQANRAVADNLQNLVQCEARADGDIDEEMDI